MTSLRHQSSLAYLAVLLATLAAGILVPSRAYATGFLVARFGGEHGNPMTDDPTALYWNPAGIAFASGTNLYVEGLFALRTYSFTRDRGGIDNPNKTPGTPDPAFNSGKGSLSNLLASPFIGITSDLGVPNLGVGLSVSVPFGGSQSWDKQTGALANNPMYPGAVDGAQRWWDIEGVIQAVYFTVGGAYKLPHNIAIGLAVNVITTKTNDLRAAEASGNDDLVNADGSLAEGRAILDTSSTTLSIGAGIAWQPTPEWRLGFSYQSQPGLGTVTEDGTLQKNLGAAGNSKNDIEQKYSLPDVFRLGVSWRAKPDLEFRVWGGLERWSSFTSQCILDKTVATRSCDQFTATLSAPASAGVINNIPRLWQDAGTLRVSGSYWVKPTIELQLGFGLDGDAVPDKTLELSLPDNSKVSGTLGAVFRNFPLDRMLVHIAYSAFLGLERTVAPDQIERFDFPSRIPNSAGTYSQFIGLLTLGVGYKF